MGLWRMPWRSKIGPIGLDLGGEHPRAVQVRMGSDALTARGEASDLRGQDLASRAWSGLEAIRSAKFVGREIVVGLPASAARMHVIRMPAVAEGDAREAIAWEASERCGLERSAIVADSIATGAPGTAGDGREERIVVAASHDELLAAFEVFLAAGYEPVAAEPRFAAIARALSRRTRRDADQSVVRAIVHVEHEHTTVMVVRGDQVAFCREVAIGGLAFDQAVAGRLGSSLADAAELRRSRLMATTGRAVAVDAVADEAALHAVRPTLDALAGEVALCLRYFGVTFRGGQPSRIVLSGAHGAEPRFAEILGETCRASVDSFEGDLSPEATGSEGGFAPWLAAFGLACRTFGHSGQERAA